MSLVGPGQVVTAAFWNTHILNMGIGDESTPGDNERRVFLESGEYILKFWNGSTWKKANRNADQLEGHTASFFQNASNLNSGTIPQARLSATDLLTILKTVDGSGSGLDADLLDGQHASYYRNAGNLNAGDVSRSRLGDIWNCNDDAVYSNPFIQSGTDKVYGPSAGWHTFTYAYTSSVSVVATSRDNGEFCSVTSTTTTGFIIRHPTDVGNANWIAVGSR